MEPQAKPVFDPEVFLIKQSHRILKYEELLEDI
jgi:hypothetical protein